MKTLLLAVALVVLTVVVVSGNESVLFGLSGLLDVNLMAFSIFKG